MKNTPNIEKLEDLDELLKKRILDHKIQSLKDFYELIENYNTVSIQKAVDLFYSSIIDKKIITGIYDSDMDGLGTATLGYRFFSEWIQYPAKIVITDRKRGYGFIPEYIDENPSDLYFTADNGITSFDACTKALSLNKNVIITDHHQPEKINGEFKLPQAYALIDPYIPDDPFEFKDISGTVVFFIFLWKLLKKARENTENDFYNLFQKFYEANVDLLAITTLSDVMPINVSVNRFMVKDFIDNYFQNSKRFYLQAFKENFNSSPLASDFSFTLIPAMNATQRMATPIHGFQYLIQDNKDGANEWMSYIFQLNESRKAKQQELTDYIEKYYKEWIKDKKFILIPGQFKKEYDGILGIIAGRIAEKYKRPCVVCNIKNPASQSYSGSGRSVGQLDILGILREIREENPDLITHLGGHKAALGVGFKIDKLNDIFVALQNKLQDTPDEMFQSKMKADFYINIQQLSLWDIDLYYHLLKWEPFGHKFKKPTFKTRCYLKNYRIIGKNKNHLTLTITDQNGILSIKALWFFHNPEIISKLDKLLSNEPEDSENSGNYLEIIWQPELDSYKGNERLSIRILDIL
jgi:single-stranded-DNA-specific exonuclease